MTQKITPFIYLLFLFGSLKGTIAQEITLLLSSKNSLDSIFLQKIEYRKTHNSLKTIHKEVELISKNLKTSGYFNNSISSSFQKGSIYYTVFHLGKKTKAAVLKITPYTKKILKLEKTTNKIKLKINKLPVFLNSISNKLEKRGNSFSKTRLKNITLKNNVLFAELEIIKSPKRKIDKTLIKGYDNFSKAHLKHFMNIKKNTIFNQQKLQTISENTKLLSFIKEIKPPEVLFSKDSTLLYLYIKKNTTNSFDGLIGFNSKKNGNGLIFNGRVNLELINILDTGEQFHFSWKANGEERQSFDISTEVPYIFNSAITPSFSFNIYKQDSTFLNTKFSSKFAYNINPKTSLKITLDSESSNNTLKNTTFNTKKFRTIFYGTELTYQISNKNILFKNTFLLKITPSFGNKKTELKTENQFKLHLISSYLIPLNKSHFIFLKGGLGYLKSKSYVLNELFRIGGEESIRGVVENSIFTSRYFHSSIEYRFLINNQSYLYSITDYGLVKDINNKTIHFTSFGLGYNFPIKNSLFSLQYIVPPNAKSSFGIRMRSFF